MRSTIRFFMAAILFIAAAGAASAQTAGGPPPAGNITSAEMGIGGWFIAGIALVALAGIISMIRRRKTKTETSIVDFTAISPELKAPVTPRN
jgi:hypothetical protein